MRFSRALGVVGVCVIALLAAARPGSAQPSSSLHFHDGLIRVEATHATVAQILERWATVGHTTIAGAGELSRVVTLEAAEIDEADLLALLVGSSGYVATTRAAPVPGWSRYSSIRIGTSVGAPATTDVPASEPEQAFEYPSVGEAESPTLPDIGDVPSVATGSVPDSAPPEARYVFQSTTTAAPPDLPVGGFVSLPSRRGVPPELLFTYPAVGSTVTTSSQPGPSAGRVP